MAVKIPQDVRERQLRELAEADGYTFAGWVDGYKNNKSKVAVDCPSHGRWDVELKSFVLYDSRCSACKGKRLVSRFDREQQIADVAVVNGWLYEGVIGDFIGVFSKIRLTCPVHGEWTTTINSIVNNKRGCGGCGINKRSMTRTVDKDVRERQIRTIAKKGGYSFVRFEREYEGVFSNVIIRCPVHGEWSVSLDNFINQGTGCVACGIISRAASRRIPQYEREMRINKIAIEHGYSFMGWVDKYKNCDSRMVMECVVHGKWETTPDGLEGGNRCPGCAQYGYSTGKSGVLYALFSRCGQFVKIGISNSPDRRHRELKHRTPFDFTIHRQLHCEDGSIPPILEKQFHDAFPSAGLSGFDGATEWRLWHDDVNIWFDLLGG